MYLQFINKKVVALFLLILCGFIIGANKFIFDKHEPVDMKNIKYVLTLSKDSADREAYLVFISKEGKTLKTLKYSGCSTLSINKDNGEFVIHSHKRNEHYRFTKEGKFKPYSLLKNKYKKEDWEGMASLGVAESKDGLIETMNIGSINGKYLTNVLYKDKKNGKLNEMVFEDDMPDELLDYKGKIFIAMMFEKDEEDGIKIIDKKKKKAWKLKCKFKNIASSKRLMKLGKYVITYGDDSAYLDKKTYTTKIASINAENFKTKVATIPNKQVVVSYIHDELIHFISNDGYYYKYDKQLHLKHKEKIKNEKVYRNLNDNNFILNRKMVKETENYFYIFRVSGKLKNDLIGYIEEYDKKDLRMVQRVKVSLPGVKTWQGEATDYYVID